MPKNIRVFKILNDLKDFKDFKDPITLRRTKSVRAAGLLLRERYSGFTSERYNSSSWVWSMYDGASSITSRPALFLGNAM